MASGKRQKRAKKLNNYRIGFNCEICHRNVDVLVPNPNFNPIKKKEARFCCQKCAAKVQGTQNKVFVLQAA